MISRRAFLGKVIPVVGVGITALVATRAFADSPATPAVADTMAVPMVSETETMAVALGYVMDATHVDATKYPQHKPDQVCSDCQLYQGKAGDKTGPCPIFAGHLVEANGWCVSFVKKA